MSDETHPNSAERDALANALWDTRPPQKGNEIYALDEVSPWIRAKYEEWAESLISIGWARVTPPGKIDVPREAFDALREPGPGNYRHRPLADECPVEDCPRVHHARRLPTDLPTRPTPPDRGQPQ